MRDLRSNTTLQLLLHRLRAFDTEPGEREGEFAEGDCSYCEQKGFAHGVGLGEDVVIVIEAGELLCKLEGMPGKMCRLGGGDALIENHRPAASAQQERPDCEVLVAGDKGRGVD